MSSRDEYRVYTKTGKKHLYAGSLESAERCFLRALELANDPDSRYASQRGIIIERLGATAAELGDLELAVRRFKRALHLIDNDPIALAICRRNWANVELTRENYLKARRLNEQALQLLERARLTRSSQRLDIEIAVTRGFLARVELQDGHDTARAIQTLREVAQLLQAYDRKPVYELDNLLWLIEALPTGPERDEYLARAIELSTRLGNIYLRGELQALSVAGVPGRSIYRLGVQTVSFGIQVLKGMKRLV